MLSDTVSAMKLKLKLTYDQITLNRVTTVFFLFSIIHCLAQGIIQSLLFSIDSQFAGLITEVVHAAEIPLKNITYLEGSSHSYHLRMCNDIPWELSISPCIDIFQSNVDVRNVTQEAVGLDSAASLSIFQDLNQGFSLSTNRDSSNNSIGVIFHPKVNTSGESIFLNKQCTQILVYPKQVLQNAVREDLTSIFLQFWLLGVSVFAVSQSSVSHILTALGTRILITAWSAYITSFRTLNQKTIFYQLVSAPGTPCSIEMFPTYFGMRQTYDIADLILSCTALSLSVLLSWNLLRVYNAQSFNRVGAPDHIIRVYKFFMAVQACLQLEVFVLVAALGLWANILVTTGISQISIHTQIYNALIITTTVLLIPWITVGWYGIVRENKKLMMAFLGISFFFITGWSLMFYSIVYRWSFLQWPYLGCFTVASFVLIISSSALGTICWMNFDKGLAQYLHAEAALASLNFSPEVFEHSDVEKSGKLHAYHEPEYPVPTFDWPAPKAHSGGNEAGNPLPMPAPLRGPPPVYDKPFSGPF